MTPTSTPTPTPTPSLPAPLPPPVFAYAADAHAAAPSFDAYSPVFAPDRCGAPGGSLATSPSSLLWAPPAPQLPAGSAPRTVGFWLRCAPGANGCYNEAVGMGVFSCHQRFSLGICHDHVHFVGHCNDLDLRSISRARVHVGVDARRRDVRRRNAHRLR